MRGGNTSSWISTNDLPVGTDRLTRRKNNKLTGKPLLNDHYLFEIKIAEQEKFLSRLYLVFRE